MTRPFSRCDGRYPGQGWFLENEAHNWLLSRERMVSTRVPFWVTEVDVVALREDEERPRRLLGSCKDWFRKEKITPCILWRLIALAMTARAEPLLIYNHRSELTDKARRIAKNWRVRLATDKDVFTSAPLPEPERPARGINTQYPPLLRRDIDRPHKLAPDYYGQLATEVADDKLDINHR